MRGQVTIYVLIGLIILLTLSFVLLLKPNVTLQQDERPPFDEPLLTCFQEGALSIAREAAANGGTLQPVTKITIGKLQAVLFTNISENLTVDFERKAATAWRTCEEETGTTFDLAITSQGVPTLTITPERLLFTLPETFATKGKGKYRLKQKELSIDARLGLLLDYLGEYLAHPATPFYVNESHDGLESRYTLLEGYLLATYEDQRPLPDGLNLRLYGLRNWTPVRPAITLDPIPDVNLTVGEHFTYYLSGDDIDAYFSETPWFPITTEGEIDYTPKRSDAGEHWITILGVNDADVASATLHLTVFDPTFALVLSNQSITAGENFTYRPLIDGTRKGVTYALDGPEGATMREQEIFWETPDAGNYKFTLTAKREGRISSGTFTLEVQP